MPAFHVVIDGQANIDVPADHGLIKIEVSAFGMTSELAQKGFESKATALEDRICPGSATDKKQAKKAKKEKNADFVVVDGQSALPGIVEVVDPMSPLFDLPTRTKPGFDRYFGPTLRGIESWVKAPIQIKEAETYQIDRKSRRKRGMSQYGGYNYDRDLDGGEDPMSCYTASAVYTITFDDLAVMTDFAHGTDQSNMDTKILDIKYSLQPATQAAMEATLRENSARNALMQARDYCKGLMCNSRTTSIAPVEIFTGTGANSGKYGKRTAPERYPGDRHPYDRPIYDDLGFPIPPASADADIQNLSATAAQSVELKHSVEVSFRIE